MILNCITSMLIFPASKNFCICSICTCNISICIDYLGTTAGIITCKIISIFLRNQNLTLTRCHYLSIRFIQIIACTILFINCLSSGISGIICFKCNCRRYSLPYSVQIDSCTIRRSEISIKNFSICKLRCRSMLFSTPSKEIISFNLISISR